MNKKQLICKILDISESTFYRNKKTDSNITYLLTQTEDWLGEYLKEQEAQDALRPTKTRYLETIAYGNKKLAVFECMCTNIIAVERRFMNVEFYCNFCEQTSHVDIRHTYNEKSKGEQSHV